MGGAVLTVSHYSDGRSPLFLAVAAHKLLWWWLDKTSIRLGGLSCYVIACVCTSCHYFLFLEWFSPERQSHWHSTICFVLLAMASSGKGMAVHIMCHSLRSSDFGSVFPSYVIITTAQLWWHGNGATPLQPVASPRALVSLGKDLEKAQSWVYGGQRKETDRM